jgi:hypothetical protein
MARFIGRLQGARGAASRLGSSGSGVVASAGGWEIGGRVHVWVGENGKDQVSFWLTAGSNARKPDVLLFTAEEGGELVDFVEQPARVVAS